MFTGHNGKKVPPKRQYTRQKINWSWIILYKNLLPFSHSNIQYTGNLYFQKFSFFSLIKCMLPQLLKLQWKFHTKQIFQKIQAENYFLILQDILKIEIDSRENLPSIVTCSSK